MHLTPEERDHIVQGKVIQAASIVGGAPLHYIDAQGNINGIAVRLLDKIAAKTGLVFEYKLYDSVAAAFDSNADLLFGLTIQYAPADMLLSQPYLKTETVLFMNSALDSKVLDDKIYAALKGGTLPEGVKEENTIYYATREETLKAVETGQADYGYGNAYSVAFYMLQNGYKNIVTIPEGREEREYCMGFPMGDEILLSIINKALGAIGDRQMHTLILDVASQVDRRITPAMVMNTYGVEIGGIIFLLMGVLVLAVISNIRANKKLELENRRYEYLAHISNECLFEYCLEDRAPKLSKKCAQILESREILADVSTLLKDTLTNENTRDNVSVLQVPLAGGGLGVFKAYYSGIHAGEKQICFIGKLIDISEETAEKNKLITLSQRDGLTGLYNAVTSRALIAVKIKKRSDSAGTDAFILIDFDKLKSINDTHGHLAGDKALTNVSRGLRLTFRDTDIIGRVGGDEFAVYMENIPSVDFIKAKCQQLNRNIGNLNGGFDISVSMGTAIVESEKTYEELFKKADRALYQAKSEGRARVVIYGKPNNLPNGST